MKKNNKFQFLSILYFAAVLVFVQSPGKSFGAVAEELIRPDEVLSLDRCIQIALVKQPSILAAFYTVEVNRSRIGEAQSNYFPQIGASGGYTRIKPIFETTSGGFTTSPSAFDQFTSSITLSQNIYDFGKTHAQVKIQKL